MILYGHGAGLPNRNDSYLQAVKGEKKRESTQGLVILEKAQNLIGGIPYPLGEMTS